MTAAAATSLAKVKNSGCCFAEPSKTYIFAGCSTINVNLRNEVLNIYAHLNGSYQSATCVNGKPSWKNDEYAIWYILTGCVRQNENPTNFKILNKPLLVQRQM